MFKDLFTLTNSIDPDEHYAAFHFGLHFCKSFFPDESWVIPAAASYNLNILKICLNTFKKPGWICLGELFQDSSWIQNFEANFVWKVSLKMMNEANYKNFSIPEVPYFHGDWSLPLIQEGLLSVTSESMCTKYWLTACSSLPRKKCAW